MVGDAVEQRGRHLRIAEHGGPFPEGQVRRHDDRGTLVKTADQVEQQLTAGLCKGQIAELVEDEEVEAAEGISGSALAIVTGLDVQLVDEVDRVEEAPAGPVMDTGAGNTDGEVGLACPRPADQDDVALLCEEVSSGEVPDRRFIDRGIFEPELFDLLGQWQFRDCHLVLDRPGVRPLSGTRGVRGLTLADLGLQKLTDHPLRVVLSLHGHAASVPPARRRGSRHRPPSCRRAGRAPMARRASAGSSCLRHAFGVTHPEPAISSWSGLLRASYRAQSATGS